MQMHPVVLAWRPAQIGRTRSNTGREHFFVGQVHPANARFTVVSFQGCGVLANTFVRSVGSAQTIVASARHPDSLMRIISESSGAYTAHIIDSENQDLYILNDPLGGGLLMRYYSRDLCAYGSDVNSIRVALHRNDRQLTRDIMFELSRAATGTASYGADTPFKNLDVLKPGIGVLVSSSGVVSSLSYGLDSQRANTIDVPYEDLIEAGIRQIRRNIESVVSCDGVKIYSDITGGFDSRLVLSALTNIHAQDRVTLTSIGDSAEWEYALGLAGETRFGITDQRFMGGAPKSPLSFIETSISGARSSGGVLDNGMDPLTPVSPIVTLQGGYGETFRTFSNFHYRSPLHRDIEGLTSGLWAWSRLFRTTVAGANVYSDALRASLSSRFSRLVIPAVEQQLPADYLTNYSYLASRNRYWIGQQSYWRSLIQSRFDPLYSGFLILAAERLTFEPRRANHVGLDVMKRLDPNLIGLPFFNKGVVTPTWLESNRDISFRPFDSHTPERSRRIEMPQSTYVRDGLDDACLSDDNEVARRFGVNAYEVAGVRKWGGIAFSILEQDAELKQYFNLPALKVLLHAIPNESSLWNASATLLKSLLRAGTLNQAFDSADDSFMFGTPAPASCDIGINDGEGAK